MQNEVDLHKLQAHSMAYSTQLLKGILKVLTDMHCKDWSDEAKADYLAKLKDDMGAFKDFLMEASKPSQK